MTNKLVGGEIMTYHKLYHIVFRRTDYHKLQETISELIYPERYEEQRRKTKEFLGKLYAIRTFTEKLAGSYFWNN